MKKREFLKLTGIVGAGAIVSPFFACSESGNTAPTTPESVAFKSFELPALGFGYADLEPSIDSMTMEIHYEKHHGGYVKNLNAALEGMTALHGLNIDEIMAAIERDNTAVRNNGGGHYNHSLFWQIITPGGSSTPTGQVAEAINSTFGSFDQFAELFAKAAMTRFGSGWAWLSVDDNGKLFVSSTPNQDNPHMFNIVDQPGYPVLGIDVWEHAYYLNYQNKRGDYVNAFMDLINWDVVEKRYLEIIA